MYQYRLDGGGAPDFALINGGGVRATIDEGKITRGEVLTSFPFGNAIVEVTYDGETLWKILEGLVSMVNQFTGEEVGSLLQLSKNIKVEYICLQLRLVVLTSLILVAMKMVLYNIIIREAIHLVKYSLAYHWKRGSEV